jgi:hypothetical protein
MFTKEKSNCIHDSNDEPHTHGKLTFHLIEGLDGKAAYPENGLITIGKLELYIHEQMKRENRQKNEFYFAITNAYESNYNIIIAVSQKEFDAKIYSLILSEEISLIKNHKNNFINIKNIINAAKKVNELIILDPKNKEIPKLQGLIDNALDTYKQFTINWLINMDMDFVIEKINEISNFLWDEFRDVVSNLSFKELVNMPDYWISALYDLSAEVEKNTRFESAEDGNFKSFISKLRQFASDRKNVKHY